MESVIFLDVDGVLNTVPPSQPIDPEKIGLLAQLVRATGAELILHSGWRVWFDGCMQPTHEESMQFAALLADEGLTLSGMTPDLTTEEIRRTKRFSLVKASEILAWLEQHSEVKHWCVLDDLDLHNNVVAAHQVRPDANVGLTVVDINAAMAILQGE